MHPREAVHLLSPLLGTDEKARRLLINRMLDYSLKLEARWIAHQVDMGALPYFKPSVSSSEFGPDFAIEVGEHPKGDGRTIVVGGALTDLCKDPVRDTVDWHWGSATFVFRTKGEVEIKLPDGRKGTVASRWVVSEGRFRRAEVEALAASYGEASQAALATQADGSTAVSETTPSLKMGNWIAEVILYDREEGIGLGMTANGLHEKIRDQAAANAIPIPRKSTVYATCQAIIARLKASFDDR